MAKKEKWFNFIEKKAIYCFFGLFILFLIIYITFKFYFNVGYKYILCVLDYFYSQQDSIVTSATVLIGIYFTMYTIFAVYNSSSVIGKLYTIGFKTLLKLLKHAMLSSIMILVFGFLSDLIMSHSKDVSYVLNFFFSIYFILTSIICGFYIYIIFKKDIESLDKQREENIEKEVLYKNLKTFLDREQKKHE